MTTYQGAIPIPTAAEAAAKIADWVAALRRDDYPQGKNALRQPAYPEFDAYCCLGIACEISGLGEWQRDPMGVANAFYWPDGDRAYDGTLPPTVAAAYGLANTDGTFWVTGAWLAALQRDYPTTGLDLAAYLGIDECDIDPNSSRTIAPLSLAVLNDSGFAFPVIADVIESNPPGLLA